MEAPEKIYLQLDGDGGDEFVEDAATWCQDRIYDSDVEYRRVDTLSQKPEPAKERWDGCEEYNDDDNPCGCPPAYMSRTGRCDLCGE